MKTLIHITGVQYACTPKDVAAVMAEMDKEKPEVLLVTKPTHDFGITIQALVGTECRGVVSRFDLETVLNTMQQTNESVLVGDTTEVNAEGRCYTVSIESATPTEKTGHTQGTETWDGWQWVGAPLMDTSKDDARLDISLKVTLTALQRPGSMDKQTLLLHLRQVIQLALWDVSLETQQRFDRVRRLAEKHDDADVRSMGRELRHALTAMGSTERKDRFRDTYLPALLQSPEAASMLQQWKEIHRRALKTPSLWDNTLEEQLEAIEQCLLTLPGELYYQTSDFGELMHRLLYMNVPQQKLQMLLSLIVLRQHLRRMLGLTEDDESLTAQERELARRLAPIFYGKIDVAREFLFIIQGKTGTDITRLVRSWVADRRICRDQCHRPLYTILYNAGLYKHSESNWNAQVS